MSSSISPMSFIFQPLRSVSSWASRGISQLSSYIWAPTIPPIGRRPFEFELTCVRSPEELEQDEKSLSEFTAWTQEHLEDPDPKIRQVAERADRYIQQSNAFLQETDLSAEQACASVWKIVCFSNFDQLGYYSRVAIALNFEKKPTVVPVPKAPEGLIAEVARKAFSLIAQDPTAKPFQVRYIQYATQSKAQWPSVVEAMETFRQQLIEADVESRLDEQGFRLRLLADGNPGWAAKFSRFIHACNELGWCSPNERASGAHGFYMNDNCKQYAFQVEREVLAAILDERTKDVVQAHLESIRREIWRAGLSCGGEESRSSSRSWGWWSPFA